MKPRSKPKVLKNQKPHASRPQPDDFVSVARRIGADEDKERFEAKLKKDC